MKGIGRRIKRAFRAANDQWQLAALSATDQRRHLTARYIEQSSFDIDYFFHVVPGRRALFIEVPKNASSFVLTELAKLSGKDLPDRHAAHRRGASGLLSPRLMGWDRFVDLALDPDLVRFAIVRNPYERLLSCYLDKFAGVAIGDGSYISDAVLAFASLRGTKVQEGVPMTFAEFVAFACDSSPVAFDGHWAPQSRIIPSSILAPKHLLRFEALGDSLPAIFRALGAPEQQIAGLSRPHAPVSAEKLSEFYTPGLRSQVSAAYAEDFVRFGYSTAE